MKKPTTEVLGEEHPWSGRTASTRAQEEVCTCQEEKRLMEEAGKGRLTEPVRGEMGNHWKLYVLEQQVINVLNRSLATVQRIVAKEYRQKCHYTYY